MHKHIHSHIHHKVHTKLYGIKVVSTEGFQSCMFDCLHACRPTNDLQMTINITFLMNDEISGELLN